MDREWEILADRIADVLANVHGWCAHSWGLDSPEFDFESLRMATEFLRDAANDLLREIAEAGSTIDL